MKSGERVHLVDQTVPVTRVHIVQRQNSTLTATSIKNRLLTLPELRYLATADVRKEKFKYRWVRVRGRWLARLEWGRRCSCRRGERQHGVWVVSTWWNGLFSRLPERWPRGRSQDLYAGRCGTNPEQIHYLADLPANKLSSVCCLGGRAPRMVQWWWPVQLNQVQIFI